MDKYDQIAAFFYNAAQLKDLKEDQDDWNKFIELVDLCTEVDFATDVERFHKKYKIDYSGPLRRLPEQLARFRTLRLREEAEEYIKAPDIENELDAMIDSIYIALGTLHLHGFTPEKINEAWNRVHHANMSKELSSKENPSKYGDLGIGVDIVKPKGWVAPDHSDLCQD